MTGTTLADLVTAAEAQDCPVIHISKLAGRDPFIPNQPCLGDATGTLVDFSVNDYFRVQAEIRRGMVVEFEEDILGQLQFAGGDREIAEKRSSRPSKLVMGSIVIAGKHMAVSTMLDAAGQETTLIYRHLPTIAEVREYWLARMRPAVRRD